MKPVRHSSCTSAGMPNRLPATISACSRASVWAPSVGVTAAVPNGRVSWPRPVCSRSAQSTVSSTRSCCRGAMSSTVAFAPRQKLYNCAVFSANDIRWRRSKTRSSTGRLGSRQGADASPAPPAAGPVAPSRWRARPELATLTSGAWSLLLTGSLLSVVAGPARSLRHRATRPCFPPCFRKFAVSSRSIGRQLAGIVRGYDRAGRHTGARGGRAGAAGAAAEIPEHSARSRWRVDTGGDGPDAAVDAGRSSRCGKICPEPTCRTDWPHLRPYPGASTKELP